MEFDELLISTGVDSLIKLIEERKKIELNMAAKLVGIPASTIEDWAHVLEDEGIIKIEYRLGEINLIWVKAGVEEVKAERAEFARRKAAVEEDLKRLGEVQRRGREELRQQAESVEKIFAHFEESFRNLEELSKQMKGVGVKRAEVSKATVEQVDGLANKVKGVRESVGLLENQLHEHKKVLEKEDVGKKVEELEEYRKHVEELNTRVEEVLRKADEAVKKAPEKGKVDVGGLEKDMEKLEQEYKKVKDESTAVRELIGEFRQSADVLQTVRELMKNVSDSSGSVRAELQKHYDQLEAVKKSIPELEGHLKEDLELVAQYEDALKVAHDVMAKLPEKKDLIGHVEEIEKREAELVAEFRKFEKTLQAVTGNVLAFGDVVGELKGLRDEVGKVGKELGKRSKDVFETLDEETATYNTFQKIKAKTKLSIEQYLAQMEKIKEESNSVYRQLEALRAETQKQLGEMASAAGSENVQRAVQLLEELEEKKKKLEEVRKLITELNEKSAKIEKNIRILTREAELISLRGGGPTEREKEERAEKIRLTAEEQEEFEKKRKELKDLIKRLWDIG